MSIINKTALGNSNSVSNVGHEKLSQIDSLLYLLLDKMPNKLPEMVPRD